MRWLDYSTATLYNLIIISMNKLILNRVAIWQAKAIDDFAMRPSPAGRVYFENGIARTSDKPMFRYAKNYHTTKPNKKGDYPKNDIAFCLFVMTFSDAEKKIEQFLDDVAKTIDEGYAQKVLLTASAANFEYTDEYFGGKE